MAIRQLKGHKSIAEVSQTIKRVIVDGSISGTLVHETHHTVEDKKVHLLAFEKFYYRNSSRAALTVMLVEKEEGLFVDIVSTGGSQGVFFRVSWGAEDNFIQLVAKPLVEMGFKDA